MHLSILINDRLTDVMYQAMNVYMYKKYVYISLYTNYKKVCISMSHFTVIY